MDEITGPSIAVADLASIVGSIIAVGAFWAGVVIWTVRLIIGGHHKYVERLIATHDERIERWIAGHVAGLQDMKDTTVNLRETLHRVDVEKTQMQEYLTREMRENYVHRREHEEIKDWMREINSNVQKALRMHEYRHVRSQQEPTNPGSGAL